MFTRSMACLMSLVLFTADAAEDWPQWRGPDRSNVSPSKIKLLDKWPDGGPKRLWRSEKLPGGSTVKGGRPWGGCGSVVVAEGKAYIYGHFFHKKSDSVMISTEWLKSWGWEEGVPQELVDKVEEALKKCGNKIDDERVKYIDTFIAGLAPAQAKNFEGYIRARIGTHQKKVPWGVLQKLAKVRDKPFKSSHELSKASGVSFHGHSSTGWLGTPVACTSRRIVDAVICYDAQTGKKLWISEFPGAFGGRHGFNGSSTPAIARGKCYFTGSAGTYCVDAKTGKEVWRSETPFTNASPLVLNGMVYANYPDGFRAFDAETGRIKWRQKRLGNHLSSPTPWSNDGKQCLLVGGNRRPGRGSRLFCLDARSGEVLWDGSTASGASSPAIQNNTAVTFGGRVTGTHLVQTQGNNQKPGKARWNVGKWQDHGASATIFEGYVYIVGGGTYRGRIAGAHCYDLKTGALKWTEATGKNYSAGADSSSVVIADGKAFGKFQSRSGAKVIMFKADPENFEFLGLLESKNPKEDALNPYSTPTIAGGKMYVRCNKAIACYDLAK